MKRQTQIMLFVFTMALLAMLVAMFVVQRLGSLPPGATTLRQERFGSVSLQIPDSFGTGLSKQDRGWTLQEFRDPKLGVLRLGTEPIRGGNFQDACKFWFAMPSYQPGPLNYSVGRYRWFFKELRIFNRSGYALRKQGKMLRIICAFEQDGMNHWIGLDTRMNFMVPKAIFERMLLSLRLSDGSVPAEGLTKALAEIPREGRYAFFQPAWLLVVIPVLVMVMVFTVVNLIRRFSGRLPRSEVFGSQVPHFLEASMEVCFTRALQLKFMDCAVAVTDEGLTLFTFGKPLLFIPRAAYQGHITTGQGWFGNPFVSLRVEGTAQYRKWPSLHRGDTFTLKIYSPDLGRLRTALQS